MKKLALFLFVAAFAVACDNAADAEQRAKDSLDSVKNAKVDMIDSTADQRIDSVEQNIEAQKEMVDSLNPGTENQQ